jgi:hypothetical protein
MGNKNSIYLDMSKIDFSDPDWLNNYRIKNYKDNAHKAHKLLEDSPIVHLGDKYGKLIEKQIESILLNWYKDGHNRVNDKANGNNLRTYYTGPEIGEIKEIFEKEFGDRIGTIAVVRNEKTKLDRNDRITEGEHWGPVHWHIDTFSDDTYTLLMYLNDVDDKTGPFEYAYPPENYVYSKDQLVENDIDPNKGRSTPPNASVVVTGPKYTSLLFSSYLIHRGNYASEKERTALWITFNLTNAVYAKEHIWKNNAKK